MLHVYGASGEVDAMVKALAILSGPDDAAAADPWTDDEDAD